MEPRQTPKGCAVRRAMVLQRLAYKLVGQLEKLPEGHLTVGASQRLSVLGQLLNDQLDAIRRIETIVTEIASTATR